MLNMTTLPLGSYQTNCYILWNEGSATCAVIDPGDQPERVLAETARLGLTIEAILLTHGHFDHVGAVEALWEATGCRLWMHEGDWSQRPDPTNLYFYPLANCDFTEVQLCEEGEVIHAGGLTFTVLSTPGHTWGSVCYACEDVLLCGDTLFCGSMGRTDLPGGSYDKIMASLKRLYHLEGDFHVCPGHDRISTLEQERQTNFFMAQAVAEF